VREREKHETPVLQRFSFRRRILILRKNLEHDIRTELEKDTSVSVFISWDQIDKGS